VRTQIARALDPTVQGSATARSTTELDDTASFDVTSASDVCWPDYSIVPRRRDR
jgi:hypothetical protein